MDSVLISGISTTGAGSAPTSGDSKLGASTAEVSSVELSTAGASSTGAFSKASSISSLGTETLLTSKRCALSKVGKTGPSG